MAYSDDYATATDAPFRNRVLMSISKTAASVAGETPTAKNRVEQKRHSLTVDVFSALYAGDSALLIDRFIYTAVPVSSLTTSSTDTNIDNSISSIWNDVAGVSGADNA